MGKQKKSSDCIFCQIIAKTVPSTIVMETDKLIVIKDIAPLAPIHYLIIPKKHVRDLVSIDKNELDLGSQIFSCAQQLAQTDQEAREFKLVINNGFKAGQRVFHLHVHFVAGFETEIERKIHKCMSAVDSVPF